ERDGWECGFALDDRRRFGQLAYGIYKRLLHIEHSRFRVGQLHEANFRLWVYRCNDPYARCFERHRDFDGLVLPPENSFWARFFPPNDPQCECRVVGTRSHDGARQLGGDPDRPLPADWQELWPTPLWVGTDWPDLLGIFHEALAAANG